MNEKLNIYAEDRRRYFRIDDEVNLYYKKVDEQVVNQLSHVSDDILGTCSLTAAIDMLSQESQLLLRRLEKTEPEITEYLKVMEDKIDLIARAVVMQGTDFSEQSVRNVNLSAAGLAFDCEEELRQGEYLEIKMLLSSSMTVIVTYVKVINCRVNNKDTSEYPYFVGVDYLNMQESDRELLIKYVVKRQMQQIREKKESLD